MPRISKSLTQAYEVQDFAFNCLTALRESLMVDGKLKVMPDDARSIGLIGKVWKEAQERIAFHRRVPSPGSLKPERAQLRRAASPKSIADRLAPILMPQSPSSTPSPSPSETPASSTAPSPQTSRPLKFTPNPPMDSTAGLVPSERAESSNPPAAEPKPDPTSGEQTS